MKMYTTEIQMRKNYTIATYLYTLYIYIYIHLCKQYGHKLDKTKNALKAQLGIKLS